MDFMKFLEPLVPSLGKVGVEALVDKLDEITREAKEPWKQVVLSLLVDAVDKHGAKGIDVAWEAIDRLVAGKPPKLDWADLTVASNILGEMQNAEADRKSEISDFMTVISEDVGRILGGILKGLLGGL